MSKKITQLPAATSVAADDLFEITHDPGGVPVSQKATLTQLRGYTVYRAILTQTAGNAPVPTVLVNSLGGVPVWSYVATGRYALTLAGAFPATKTLILATVALSAVVNSLVNVVKNGLPNSFELNAYQGGILADDTLSGAAIEILVYP